MDDDLDPKIKQKFENSQMSKAGKIAMELSQERKRLKEELEGKRVDLTRWFNIYGTRGGAWSEFYLQEELR